MALATMYSYNRKSATERLQMTYQLKRNGCTVQRRNNSYFCIKLDIKRFMSLCANSDTGKFTFAKHGLFLNLLTNAMEAIDGKGTITIRAFEENGKVHVQVVDTGVGISPDKREKLFDPGFVEKESRMKAKMGLFTSANIVQKHKGQLLVDSEVGRGSTFTVVLPVHSDRIEPATGDDTTELASRCDRLEQGGQHKGKEE